MNMKNSPKAQIDAMISQVVGEQTQHSIVKANDVADRVNRLLDPEGKSPVLVMFTSMMQLRNYASIYLARNFDPETKAKEQLSGQQDMLGEQLQTMYPVRREEFGASSAYIQIDMLTDDECYDIANKCFKIGSSYTAQGKLMLSYVNERQFNNEHK